MEIWEPGNPEMWNPKNDKNYMDILKNQILSADKVWISRKKILLAPFGAIWAQFLRGPENCKNNCICLPIFLGGPMASEPTCQFELQTNYIIALLRALLGCR